MPTLKFKDSDGNWKHVGVNIKGDKGDAYELTQTDKEDIASLVDLNSKIDKPTEPGTAGQVLGLNSDGITEWINQQGGSAEWQSIETTLTEDVSAYNIDLPTEAKEVYLFYTGVVNNAENNLPDAPASLLIYVNNTLCAYPVSYIRRSAAFVTWMYLNVNKEFEKRVWGRISAPSFSGINSTDSYNVNPFGKSILKSEIINNIAVKVYISGHLLKSGANIKVVYR